MLRHSLYPFIVTREEKDTLKTARYKMRMKAWTKCGNHRSTSNWQCPGGSSDFTRKVLSEQNFKGWIEIFQVQKGRKDTRGKGII